MLNKIINLFSSKHYRYIIIGIITFIINLSISKLIFSYPDFTLNDFRRNLGNFLSAEIALLISYPLHKRFTWLESWENFWSKLLYFHIVSFWGFIIRILIFGLLIFINMDWLTSTIISIGASVLFNFAFFDNYVFSPSEKVALNEESYAADGIGVSVLETIEEAETYNTWIAGKIEDFLGTKNLELGAGTGTIANIISKNFPIELFELSEPNQNFLKKRFINNSNIISIDGDFLQNNKTEYYDCVYSSNVLEHIENDTEFVMHGLKLLKKGGFFVAIVPAMKILYSEFDRSIGHIRRYTKKDKRRWAEKINHQIPIRFLKFDFFNPIGCLGWLVKMKIFRKMNIEKKDAMIMNSLIPFIAWLDLIKLPFGQSLLIVIKKL